VRTHIEHEDIYGLFFLKFYFLDKMSICIVIKTAFQKYKEKVQNSWTQRKPAKAKANSVNWSASPVLFQCLHSSALADLGSLYWGCHKVHYTMYAQQGKILEKLLYKLYVSIEYIMIPKNISSIGFKIL
jgi:hypothetical protein